MTLQESFENIKDERIERCKKHNLVDILMILFVGVLCGYKSIEQIQFYAALSEQNEDQSAGDITLIGNPKLVAGSTILLKNLGVFSGKYLIKQSRHSISRTQGYTTNIEVRMLEFIPDDLLTLGMEMTNANT